MLELTTTNAITTNVIIAATKGYPRMPDISANVASSATSPDQSAAPDLASGAAPDPASGAESKTVQPDVAERLVELDSEDAKLVTLARAMRARTQAREGAAVRDADGRTYAAATVSLTSLSLSALQLAAANAAVAGATQLEAAVVVTEAAAVDAAGYAVVRDFGDGVPIHVVAPGGQLVGTVRGR